MRMAVRSAAKAMRMRPTARALAIIAPQQQPELSAATKRALEAIVGEKSAVYSKAVREQHCRDESYHADTDGLFPPQAVVFPTSTEEVQEIVKMCARDKIPIVASGACTSLEGHLAALRGGVAINMREMNQVLEVNTDDLDARCQAGVTRKQLNTYIRFDDYTMCFSAWANVAMSDCSLALSLRACSIPCQSCCDRDTGLMFTVDPGADATLGGMASTRASGTNTVKYGTMRDNVLELSAVLADGSVIKASILKSPLHIQCHIVNTRALTFEISCQAGSRARKSSTGYDLKNLLVGSEGTLGIITEVTVRLFGQPEAVSSAVCEFPTLADAVNCTMAIIQMGIPVEKKIQTKKIHRQPATSRHVTRTCTRERARAHTHTHTHIERERERGTYTYTLHIHAHGACARTHAQVARIEVMDAMACKAVNMYSKMTLQV
jgi:D-lactate dehydrogenase (cytochrome)